MGCGLLEGAFRVLGKRLAARSAQQRLREDRRRPVVFLRAFADDALVVVGGSAEGSWASRAQTRRLESVLAEWFERVGPFVALGRPGERLPPLDGAARDYAGEDRQSQVDAFLNDAAIIVLVISASSGVSWEIRRLSQRGFFSKTVLIMPSVRKSELLRRWCACAAQGLAAARTVASDRNAVEPPTHAAKASAVGSASRSFSPAQVAWSAAAGGAAAVALLYAIDQFRGGAHRGRALVALGGGLAVDAALFDASSSTNLIVGAGLCVLGYVVYEARALLSSAGASNRAPTWQAAAVAAGSFVGKIAIRTLAPQ